MDRKIKLYENTETIKEGLSQKDISKSDLNLLRFSILCRSKKYFEKRLDTEVFWKRLAAKSTISILYLTY